MCAKLELEILKQKIQDLEVLKEKCTLSNDIKVALAHYIQSNEEFKNTILDQFEISNNKSDTWKSFFIALIWPASLVITVAIIAFIIYDKVK